MATITDPMDALPTEDAMIVSGRSACTPGAAVGRTSLSLWSAQAVSIIGSQFSALSIQMIAATLLKATPTQMGFLTASQTFPYLAFSLFVGVLVDRQPKRLLLISADLVRAAILIAAGFLLSKGSFSVPLLCIVVSTIAVFTLIFDASLGAVIPELFSPPERVTMNSRMNSAPAVGDVVGPSISGYALRFCGVSGTLFLDALSYLLSAVCIVVGVPSSPKLDQPRLVRTPVMRSIADGVIYVLGNPVLRILGLGSAVWNFSWSAVLSILVIYTLRELRMTPGHVGVAFALGGVGGIAGSALGWFLAQRFQRGPLLVLTPLIGILGGSILLLPAYTHPFALCAAALFLYNLGESSFGVNMQTARQAVTPLALMGRMDTAMRFCFKGMASLGAVAGGVIATHFGIRSTLWLGLVGLILTVVIFASSGLYRFKEGAFHRSFGLRREPDAIEVATK